MTSFISVSTIDDNEVPLPHFEKRTQSIISDILKTLKVNKATGPDGISHRMLINTATNIANP